MSTVPPPRGSHEETTQRLLKSIDLHLRDVSFGITVLMWFAIIGAIANVVGAVFLFLAMK